MKKLLIIFFMMIISSIMMSETLSIRTNINGAKVYVDNKLVGEYKGKDLMVKVGSGVHKIEAKLDAGGGLVYKYKSSIMSRTGKRIKNISVVLKKEYSEDYYFTTAKKTGVAKDYEVYLTKYPNGAYSKLAREELEEFYLADIYTVSGVNKYLSRYPKTKTGKRLKRKLENIYYKSTHTLKGAKTYLGKYPKGKYKKQVNRKLEFLYYKNANTSQGYIQYVKKYPRGKYLGQLKSMKAEIEYQSVKNQNNESGYKRYLKKYPRTSYKTEIKQNIEKIYYSKARNLRGIKKYKEKYPNGRYLKEINEKEEGLLYKQVKTMADVRDYLRKYPKGKYAKILKSKREEFLFNKKDIYTYLAYAKEFPQGKHMGSIKKFLYEKEENKSFAFVKGGSFTMGSDSLDKEIGWDEKPARKVKLSSFMMGRTEVSFEDFDKFCEEADLEKVNDRKWGRGKRPVINVTFEQAIAYCNWLSKEKGLPVAYNKDGNLLDENGNETKDISQVFGYRLPTEAEWEYAAKGGKNTNVIYSGSEEVREIAWYSENSKQKTNIVASKKANSLGIYDMSGNVWEWCSDYYSSSYYEKNVMVNPYNSSGRKKRVLRGGGWKSSKKYMTVSNRYYQNQDSSQYYIGFRLARTSKNKYVETVTKYDNVYQISKKLEKYMKKLEKAEKNMVLVKGGIFKIGDDSEYSQSDEGPTKKIKLNDYYIAKYETSFADYDEYSKFSGTGMKDDKTWGRGKRPVIKVSWYDAIAYCNWLSESRGLPEAYNVKTGAFLDANGRSTRDITRVKGYRLPTEAEWEYAAKAGEDTIYSGSNSPSEVAVYGKKATEEIGTKKANDLGLYDMSGNVWEWCTDYYKNNYYAGINKENPYNNKRSSTKTLRGGGWRSGKKYMRISNRYNGDPKHGYFYTGFRVVRSK